MGELDVAELRTTAKTAACGDVPCLHIQICELEQRSRLYRFGLHGKPHPVGVVAE